MWQLVKFKYIICIKNSKTQKNIDYDNSKLKMEILKMKILKKKSKLKMEKILKKKY